MQHAVLDTNILVSALIRPQGPPGLVMAAVMRGDLVPVFSDEILTEYERVLRRPRLRLDAVKVQAMLEALRLVGVRLVVESAPPPFDLPDRNDWPFIACGFAAGCPVVTGNVKDFPKRAGISVMTAREWVEHLRSQSR